MKKSRRWLYLVLAAGLIALGAGGGTFASFNAQTVNKTNQFKTGTLLLTDSSCKSTAGANNSNTTCSAIVSVTTADATTSVIFHTVTLKNAGSITASDFYLGGKGTCVNTRTTLGTLNKTTTLCTGVDLFIEELSQTTGPHTYEHCWYGGTGKTCATTAKLATALTGGNTYGTNGTTHGKLKLTSRIGTVSAGNYLVLTTGVHTQKFKVKSISTTTVVLTGKYKAKYSFGTTTYVLDPTKLSAPATVATFEATHKIGTTTTHPQIRLLPLTATNTLGAATAAPDLKAGKTRKFLVGLYLGTQGNSYQGITATFKIAWHITQ